MFRACGTGIPLQKKGGRFEAMGTSAMESEGKKRVP